MWDFTCALSTIQNKKNMNIYKLNCNNNNNNNNEYTKKATSNIIFILCRMLLASQWSPYLGFGSAIGAIEPKIDSALGIVVNI